MIYILFAAYSYSPSCDSGLLLATNPQVGDYTQFPQPWALVSLAAHEQQFSPQPSFSGLSVS